jgi:5-methyltetrahydropteroyltriglutamate--homocysteine methyltransferase
LLQQRKDWQQFSRFYQEALSGGTLFTNTRDAPSNIRAMEYVCVGPVSYAGHAALAREIDILRDALGDADLTTAFLTSTVPASLEPRRPDEYYRDVECAEEPTVSLCYPEHGSRSPTTFHLEGRLVLGL